MTVVLVADDDADIRDLVAFKLEQAGLEVVAVEDGEAALEQARAQQPALAVLDISMPGLSGIDVCRMLRADPATAGMLIIMLTARVQEQDVEGGFSAGADDYVTKPFSPRELVARIRAVLRRVPGANEAGPEEIVVGPLTLYPRRFQAEIDGKPVRLTPTEFNLVRTMAEAPGQVFSRAQLIEKAFGYDFDGFERNVDVHVTSLRRKLEKGSARLIKTVYGLGYKIEPEPAGVGSRQ